jgi:hypothetical protein
VRCLDLCSACRRSSATSSAGLSDSSGSSLKRKEEPVVWNEKYLEGVPERDLRKKVGWKEIEWFSKEGNSLGEDIGPRERNDSVATNGSKKSLESQASRESAA